MRTAKDVFRYARKFYQCLLSRDFGELQMFSGDKRVHVMKALSALSKFLGVYDEFKMLVRNYGLSWSVGNSDDLVIARITKTVKGDEITSWVRKVKAEVSEYAVFMDFLAATGLRYVEAINSWNLIIRCSEEGRLGEYYNTENGILEHFRFKDVFIRRTKKAFISFMPQHLMRKIICSRPLTANALRKRLQRRKIRLRFGDVREFHANILTKHLRQPEIDFLQGRISANVFMRHYFNPAWITDLKERTLKTSKEILTKIN